MGAILVTGASGMLGRHLVDALVDAGETVVAGVRDPRARIADTARRASGGSSTRRAPTVALGATPTRVPGKPVRAPGQKPAHNPAHKPPRQSVPGLARPGATADLPPTSAPAADGGPGAGHAGAQPRAFDLRDRSGWAHALAGVDRVVLIRPATITDVARTLIPFIDTAMDSGVRQLVFVTQPGPLFDTHSPQHLVEQYLKRTRAPYTLLRPTLFLQNLTEGLHDDIRRRNEIVLPTGGARVAFVDARDVGRVAARVLTEPGHLRRSYHLAGESAFGYREVAELLSGELGRDIHYEAVTAERYRELLVSQGMRPETISADLALYRVARARVVARPNRSIHKLTGRPATTLAEFVREHRASWQ